MTDEEREAEHRRVDAMYQHLNDSIRQERDRNPIAYDFRLLCKHLEHSQDRMEASWKRAMEAIEQAANAWEAKANDR